MDQPMPANRLEGLAGAYAGALGANEEGMIRYMHFLLTNQGLADSVARLLTADIVP